MYPGVPELGHLQPGPVLAKAQAQGVLTVALRSYPRPSASSEALLPEPDLMDLQLARYLAAALGVRVQLAAPAEAQLLINPANAPRGMPAEAPAPPAGAVLGLRLAAGDSVAGQSICLAQGSPWQAALEKRGARAQVYPSSLRASVAFMGGECQYYADARNTLAGLLQLPQWRFYRVLPLALDSPADARVYLAGNDPASRAWLQAALAQWHRDGQQASAWAQHADQLLTDSLKLADGLVCH
ncbi:ABC transporter substrate-binding protein [Pseudomonas sp. C2L12B]|uniref:ABC transporter substrate-binding protein n=1 Tax=Pseudomonas typographi TaxID=2715964 RepID=A0ABR7YWL2_9PSED|nr:ABC transporter substrate-binding protein [Pseudomonas typographi]MBD1585507.1 ABC transporter substrate-binding protein [Pseudomonas typographi]MBD1597578.1 ABC transporter substrate-binding protein [Pseudomonas typographi]